MKFPRILAAVLILVMVSSQALANVCSTSCLYSEMQSTITSPADSAKNSDHCDQCPKSHDQGQSRSKHQMCLMAGCYSVQGAHIEPIAVHHVPEFSNTLLPLLTPNGFSAELSPPIKPPA